MLTLQRIVPALALWSAMIGPLAAGQPNYNRSGMLNCKMAPSIGLILGSHQTLACSFVSDRAPVENYVGSITNVGIDIGVTAGGAMGWAVLLATTDPHPGALAGTYVGASGDVAAGIGAGANVLVGGSNSSVVLQPVSVEGEIGLNVTLAVSDLQLRLAP
jgi:hypothetical protein